MRDSILANFKQNLTLALEHFEQESGGRHNRRSEISSAINTIEEYISRAQNPLILLNTLEIYIKNYLSGFFKALLFRDEYRLKKCLVEILLQPEYSIQSLSYTLWHEAEVEKLSLYRLISQLEERLRNVESEKEDASPEIAPINQIEFDDLRSKISYLEECEKQAHIKIVDLENEKWIKEREIIELHAKIELLTNENNKLKERHHAQQEDLKKIQSENQTLKKESSTSPEKFIKKTTPHLIYQNNSKPINAIADDSLHTESCRIV